ncbi:MAG: TolC family protein [Chitinophagaceae bacterium]|nr:TolC family protein [Chitinophagaceae bacterium]
MKTGLKISLICLLHACFYNTVSAQTAVKPDTLIKKTAVDFPPLADLIDSAIKHNAMFKYRTLDIDVKQSNLTSQRNYWLRNLGVQGDSRYGTIDAFSTNANGVSSNFSNTSSKQMNYAIGVYVKIPIYDLVNRKTHIKQAKTELEEARMLAVVQQDEIRQIVIRQYQDLLLRQKLLSIKSQNLGSATVNMEMVEKEFRNGVIPITEYVRLSDMAARIQAEYEMASSDFLVSKKILEEIVGFSFKNPDLSKK